LSLLQYPRKNLRRHHVRFSSIHDLDVFYPNATNFIGSKIWDRRFYLIMAIASTVLVFLAFARTFYLKPYFGTRPLSALVELHGIVFTTWMFFFIAQTALIASNRPEVHRKLGYAGGVLAAGMVVLGTMVAFVAERRDFHEGAVRPDTTFLFSLADILTFSIFIAAGFLWRRRREAHQRLMLLAVVAGLLEAAPPRLPLVGGHPARMAGCRLGVSSRRSHLRSHFKASDSSGLHLRLHFRFAHRSTCAYRPCRHPRLAPHG
jgi:hypothetical protein